MPKTRKLYSKEEDRKIVQYIEIHKTGDVFLKGNVFWKELQSSAVLPNRTWHSLRDRYLKYLKLKRPNHVRNEVKDTRTGSDVSIQDISSETEDESDIEFDGWASGPKTSANYRDEDGVDVEEIQNSSASSRQRMNDRSSKALSAFDKYLLQAAKVSERHKSDNLKGKAESPKSPLTRKTASERGIEKLIASERDDTAEQVEIKSDNLKRKVESCRNPMTKQTASKSQSEVLDASEIAETSRQVDIRTHDLKRKSESTETSKRKKTAIERENEILDASKRAETFEQVGISDEVDRNLESEGTNENKNSERAEITGKLSAGQKTYMHLKSQLNLSRQELAVLKMIAVMRSKVTATLSDMFFALHQTNANLEDALACLCDEEPMNFWTPEEDKDLRGRDEEAIKAIIVKHGHLAVQQRLKFLKGKTLK